MCVCVWRLALSLRSAYQTQDFLLNGSSNQRTWAGLTRLSAHKLTGGADSATCAAGTAGAAPAAGIGDYYLLPP